MPIMSAAARVKELQDNDVNQSQDINATAVLSLVPPLVKLTKRPKLLGDVVGQSRVLGPLSILIESAIKNNRPVRHILFRGPAGTGKTTLAQIVCNEQNANRDVDSLGAIRFHEIQASELKTARGFAESFAEVSTGDVVHIDEAHGLPKSMQERLGTLMEDESVLFTLICSTTNPGKLTRPFLDRFKQLSTDYYPEDELCEIVTRYAEVIDVEIDELAAMELAIRGVGTPRIATSLLDDAKEYADVVDGTLNVTHEVVLKAMRLAEIDKLGLDRETRKVLECIAITYAGGPIGLEPLANTLCMDKASVEDMEKTLCRLGLMVYAGRGRKATRLAYSHLGKKVSPLIF